MFQNLSRGFASCEPHDQRRRRLCAALLATATTGTLAAQPIRAQGPCTVAFVYLTPIGDAGWTYQHDLGRREMERALGSRVKTTIVESVAEGPDSERVFRSLCADGAELVIATSFGYLEPALRVAADYPNVKFEHAGGYKTAPNLATYNARYYQARYLAGMLAARTSQSGKVGYVAGFPVPEVVQGINAFALGLRSLDPKAEVRPIFIDAWFDPARERDAALTLVNQGADIITHHSGSTAVAQLAEEKRVRVISYQSDMRRVAPRAQLAAIASPWGGFYTRTVQAVLDGTWKPVPVWGGIKDGMVELAAVDPGVPADVRQMLDKARADIVSGRLDPFGGTLVDAAGRTRSTQALGDAEIERMDWFVAGVVGGKALSSAGARP